MQWPPQPYSEAPRATGRSPPLPLKDEALSEERYRFLFEFSPAAVYSIDASGVIQDFNLYAAELWGRSPASGDTDERFCGSHKMFRPDGTFMPHGECPMAQVVAGKVSEVTNAEVVILRPDGSRITAIVNIRPLKGPHGEIVGAINCFYDITERSRMEQLLKQQADTLTDMNRRKDEFLATLSHELRNPLAPIVNAVQVLEKLGADPEQKRFLTIAQRQLAHLTRLVGDLLDASRISTGRVQLKLDDVVINSVVEGAVQAVRHMIEERRQDLVVAVPPEPIRLRADAVRLEQIMINLLANAAKYTKDGGRISLSVEQRGSECTLRVRDTGIGIAPELLPRVFDLFTQAAPFLDRSQGGLGIGLALVKSLVELHEGRVEARSTPGEGSEFVVTLPALPSLGPGNPRA
jgi:PAS domain S-box-containing protein